jgi:hypothetical protein
MSTLDERLARDCERSGVPFFVEDEALLDKVAGWLFDTWIELATDGTDGTDGTGEGADHARPA